MSDTTPRQRTLTELLTNAAYLAQAHSCLNAKVELILVPEGVMICAKWTMSEGRHVVTWDEIINSRIDVLGQEIKELASI